MGYECTRVVRLNLNSHRASPEIAALFTIAVNNNSHNKHNRRSLVPYGCKYWKVLHPCGEGASQFSSRVRPLVWFVLILTDSDNVINVTAIKINSIQPRRGQPLLCAIQNVAGCFWGLRGRGRDRGRQFNFKTVCTLQRWQMFNREYGMCMPQRAHIDKLIRLRRKHSSSDRKLAQRSRQRSSEITDRRGLYRNFQFALQIPISTSLSQSANILCKIGHDFALKRKRSP